VGERPQRLAAHLSAHQAEGGVVTDTFTLVMWKRVADKLDEGYPIVPFATGSQCRMAPDLANYIRGQIDYQDLTDPLTLDWGDEGWDAHLSVNQAAQVVRDYDATLRNALGDGYANLPDDMRLSEADRA
jgi:hypothetical protein